MAKSCVYVPARGKDTFLELRRKFDYKTAKDIYLRAVNPRFLDDYKGSLRLDSDGVPTYRSIMANPYMRRHIGERQVASAIERDFPVLDDTRENWYSQLEAAYRFNTSGQQDRDFIALVSSGDGKVRVGIVPRNDGNLRAFREQYGGYKLNQRLEGIFRPIGITVGRLEDYEVKAGRTGKIDFSAAREAANGLASMIKVANNQEGAEAISEEFSHLLVAISRDNPLVSRSIAALASNDDAMRRILGDEYDDTVKFHGGDMEDVAEEAVGQVLRGKLLSREVRDIGPASRLVGRLASYIKGLFRRFRADDVSRAVNDTELYMSRFARNILNGAVQITRDDVARTERDKVFNALSDRIERNIKILRNAAGSEVRRGKLNDDDKRATEDKVRSILSYADKKTDTVEGLMKYCQSALGELKRYMDSFAEFDTLDMPTKFKFLRNVNTLVKSYGSFLQEMLDAINDEGAEEDGMFKRVFTVDGQDIDIPSLVKDVNNLAQMLERKYVTTALPMFTEFLKPFWGDDIVVPFGKDKGRKITLEDLVRHADKDISFFDRWLDSMAVSSDLLLQMFDAVVKKARDDARLRFIEKSREITALRQKAERYGITDFDWMFERDADGHKTGYYTSPVNQGQFEKDMAEFEESLRKKYGLNPKGNDARAMLAERNKWYDAHSSGFIFGRPMPDETIYHNAAFDSLTARQREIREEFLALKHETDEKYPPGRADGIKAIQQRRGTAQRIADAGSDPSGILESVRQAIAGEFRIMEDDDAAYGESAMKKGMTDFEGNEVLSLPALFTTRLKNPDELSDDIFASLMAYTYAGDTYEEMEKVIDPLEIGHDIVRNYRDTAETSGGRKVVERIRVGGTETTTEARKQRTNIQAKLDDFFESQVYGRYLKNQGTFSLFGKQVNINKLVSLGLASSSLAQLGFNFLAETANVLTGKAMVRIEAACNQFFSYKQLWEADKEYAVALKDYIPDIGARQHKSKLALFDQLFDVRQDFRSTMAKAQAKSLFRRMFGSGVAFIGQDAGDHWLYNRTAIAMALNEEVYANGKKTSLWEALEVRKDKDGVEYLAYKDIRDKDGKPFDAAAFGRKVASVNQSLFGVYNDDDMNAASRVWIGRLLQQYRKWIKPQMNKRFEKAQYNYATKTFDEGYFRTFFRFMLANANCLRRGQVQLAQSWRGLTEVERGNIRRALTEYAQFLAVCVLANLIEWPDDKDRPWLAKYAEYAAKRAQHELGGLAPSSTFLQENMKTLKSPLPIINFIQSLIDLGVSVITPGDYINEIESGPYKGMSNLGKNFIKAPLPIVSQMRQISKFTGDIDTSIQFYMRPSY